MRNQSSATEYGKGLMKLVLCDLWCVEFTYVCYVLGF